MSEYAPSTEEVLDAWVDLTTGADSRAHLVEAAYAASRRWLAAHDAEVRAEWEAEQGEMEWAIRSRLKLEHTGRENLPANRGWAFWRTGLSEDVARTDAAKYAPGYEVEVVRRRKAGPWVPIGGDQDA